MERRKALKSIGLSFGSMTLTPTLVSVFQSCQSDPDWTPRFFSSDQLEIVSKFLESANESSSLKKATLIAKYELENNFTDSASEDAM